MFDIEGPIGPAISDYVVRGLAKARETGAEVAILRLDTPGGLDTSMREIIQAILASPVPVRLVRRAERRARRERRHLHHLRQPRRGDGARHQSRRRDAGPDRRPGLPGGGRTATSASRRRSGTTAANPPRGRPACRSKEVNDAVAYIRSLAQMRGRNAEWAEQAVREAASLSAEEALKQNVIDLLAADVPALLHKLDGRRGDAGRSAGEAGDRRSDARSHRAGLADRCWR